jgi:hypothetical protein
MDRRGVALALAFLELACGDDEPDAVYARLRNDTEFDFVSLSVGGVLEVGPLPAGKTSDYESADPGVLTTRRRRAARSLPTRNAIGAWINSPRARVQVMLFARGKRIESARGAQVLKTFDAAGHLLANHSYSRVNYNDPANDGAELRPLVLPSRHRATGMCSFTTSQTLWSTIESFDESARRPHAHCPSRASLGRPLPARPLPVARVAHTPVARTPRASRGSSCDAWPPRSFSAGTLPLMP